ncbi:RRM domain-containing protein [Pseudozyma hubeiensis]|nr:RRM domain-containing protein [Pseudozyma hubeiensis]
MSGRGYDRGYDRDDRDDRGPRGGGRGGGGRGGRDRAPPTTLFVAGFPPNMRAKDLAYEFERMGPLIRCDIPALKSATATPYAFIEYEDPRDADAAFRDMHGMRFGRNEISIQFAKNAPSASWRFDGPSRGPPPPSYGGRGGRDGRDSRDDRSRSDIPPPPARPQLTKEEEEEADRAAEERARKRAAMRRERSPEPRRDDDADYPEDRRRGDSRRADDDADREERSGNGDSAANGNGAEADQAKEEVKDDGANDDAADEKKPEENDAASGWE